MRDRKWRGALPDNLRSIDLEVAGKQGTYWVELSYYYKNIERCSNWEPHQKRQGL